MNLSETILQAANRWKEAAASLNTRSVGFAIRLQRI